MTLLQINDQYLSYYKELQPYFSNITKCSIYAMLWNDESKKKRKLCKLAILKLAFNQVTTKLLPGDISDNEKLWAKVQEQYGKVSIYPQPYCKMTDKDSEMMLEFVEENKDELAYFDLTIKLLRLILNEQFWEVTSIYEFLYE